MRLLSEIDKFIVEGMLMGTMTPEYGLNQTLDAIEARRIAAEQADQSRACGQATMDRERKCRCVQIHAAQDYKDLEAIKSEIREAARLLAAERARNAQLDAALGVAREEIAALKGKAKLKEGNDRG